MAVELYNYYKDGSFPRCSEKHGYKNVHQVPKVEKVVVNTCVGTPART